MEDNYTRRDFIKTTGAAALVAAALPVWAQDDKKITVAFVGVAHIAYFKRFQLLALGAGGAQLVPQLLVKERGGAALQPVRPALKHLFIRAHQRVAAL
jgi:hypothetical protein